MLGCNMDCEGTMVMENDDRIKAFLLRTGRSIPTTMDSIPEHFRTVVLTPDNRLHYGLLLDKWCVDFRPGDELSKGI